MFRPLLLACVVSTFVTSALAQSQKLPPELAGLPDEVKGLKWQAIDWATVQPLERCRALQLLNHTLEELSANAAAEADLMSAYVEKNNLGAKFASTPPPPSPKSLNFPHAETVAVAMLRGPMSGSYYATELGDLDPNQLKSYAQMYERTCARRWGEFDESRHQVRCMSSFLGNSDKLQDYDAWATAEAIRRQAEARQRAAASAQAKAQDAAATRQNMEAQLRQQQVELTQMKAALSVADAQLQQAAAAGQPAAQSAAPAEAVAAGSQIPASGYGYGYGPYGGYGGYGYGYGAYGVRPAGAIAVDAAADRNRGYHGANATWNRESNYGGYARAQTETRMSNFHGAGRRR